MNSLFSVLPRFICLLLQLLSINNNLLVNAITAGRDGAKSSSSSSSLAQQQQQRKHLVVLSNGVMGNRHDLTFLAQQLQQRGCVVLQSTANEFTGTLQGIDTGGRKLAQEVLQFKQSIVGLETISFVGNSLGGLYTRFAIHELFDSSSELIAGLQPLYFLTIATPHLGVRSHTFLDDYGLPAPDFLKRIVARSMQATGSQLFSTDSYSSSSSGGSSSGGSYSSSVISGSSSGSSSSGVACSSTLLFQMATQPRFLQPLRVFRSRRLLANLRRDFVVPLGTAAFLDAAAVNQLRSTHSTQFGIVAVINSTDLKYTKGKDGPQQQQQQQQQQQMDIDAATGDASSSSSVKGSATSSGSDTYNDDSSSSNNAIDNDDVTDCNTVMRRSLDSVGWEKVIVHFQGTVPLAHNQIAALTKYTPLIDSLLGFNAGRELITATAEWLTTPTAAVV